MIIEYCLLIGRLFLDVEFWPPGAWPRAGHDFIWISIHESTYIPTFTLLSQSERFGQNLELIRWTIGREFAVTKIGRAMVNY